MNQNELKQIAARLVRIRTGILQMYPFFGRLLMRLPFGFAECKTAYTDMRRIVFDPDFVSRLTDEEVNFVVMHELMHCVLKHCTRGGGKLRHIYNIACDIVVNSIILEAFGLKDFNIDGSAVMHLIPNGREGRSYSADEVYEMLLRSSAGSDSGSGEGSGLDNHEIWETFERDAMIETEWDSHIRSAGKNAGSGSGIPDSMERYLANICHTEKISWRQILHDYLQNDRYDYLFSKPDRRYSDGEYIMPSFTEDDEVQRIDKVFFFVDTSASVSPEAVAEAFAEIKDAVLQVGNMSGNVLFFDTIVSEAFSFESVDDIEKMKPVGGGGTSFEPIFRHLAEYDEDFRPTVVIIITDGYATFPEKNVALDIPVIWLIVDSDVKAPWGECLHIHTDSK